METIVSGQQVFVSGAEEWVPSLSND